MSHAPLAPSAADRWVHCAGSRALCAEFPEPEDTLPAMEGTAAHWCFEQMFAGVTIEAGMLAPNGVQITDEMLDGAELFVDTVRAAAGADRIYIEDKLMMHTIIHDAVWGTPDVFVITPTAIKLFDYKFGHLYVEEFENWQCICYIGGIYQAMQMQVSDEVRVEITIVQPRVFNRGSTVRTWVTSIGELKAYWAKLAAAAVMAMCDEAPCVPGDHCEFCSGRHACEALERAALRYTHTAYSSLPLELPIIAASRELAAMQGAAKMLEARVTGLEQYLLNKVRGGASVPDFTIERAQGRQRWTKPVEQVIALGQMFGVTLGKPGAVTPKQAIKAGVPEGVVAQMSDEPLGEWRLVRVTTDKARKVFSATT